MCELIWQYSFPMKKGILDNDYEFYSDGRVKHFYDKTIQKVNIEEYVSSENIPLSEREKMLSDCPAELYDTIKKILQL